MKFFEENEQSEVPYHWMSDDYPPAASRPVLPWHRDKAAGYSERLLSRAHERLIENNPLAKLISRETLLDKLSGSGSPGSRFWKFISLVPVPVLFGAASYLFFAKCLGWWGLFSGIGAGLIFFIICAQVNSRLLRKRSSFLRVLKFIVEEIEVSWLMWMVGSLTYAYLHHHVGLLSPAGYALAMVAVVFSYLLAANHIRTRPAAETTIPYLLQVGWVVATSVVVFVASFLATPLWWTRASWPYDYYVGAILVSLFWLWVAINLFYASADGDDDSLERGSPIELS